LTQAKTHTLFEEGFEFEQEVNLEKSEYSTDCIVLGFAGEEESIEVKPRARANLPTSLTGNAVVWTSSDQGATSAYHLLDPKDPQHSSAVEYINDQWYYLTWADGKYYTTPRA
jgi:hypothetical protein